MDDYRVIRASATALDTLAGYGAVSIAFWVRSRFAVHVVDNGIGGLLLKEEPVPIPYVKDYDALEGEGPTRWLERFDLSHWTVLQALCNDMIVGGAVVASNTPGVDMLEGRDDLAILWDLRVHPDHRGRGVGHRLFTEAIAWAQTRKCRQLKIETQNVNVAACRFYARQGCVLRTIRSHAYDDLPDEVQLLWYLDIEAA